MELRCTFLANCGVLVEAGEDSLLIDAPNCEHTLFDGCPQEEVEKMAAAEAPYGGLCGLFFTHRHSDHYDRKRVRQITDSRPELTVFSPNGMTPAAGTVQAGPFFVRYASIPHSGEEFAGVFHRVLIVTIGGKTLYFTGDADWDAQAHFSALDAAAPDAIFCNPNLLSHPDGRELLRRCGKAFVCHLPEKADDALGIGRKARTCLRRYGDELPRMTLIEHYPTTVTV